LRAGRFVIAWTSVTRTAAWATAASWPWRARRFEGLLLLGSQDLVEFGLGLFFEFGNLFLLVFREVQLLDRERRDQMEPAAVTTRTARAIPRRRAAGITSVRTTTGIVLRSRSHGNGGNCDDAEDHDECWKTSHGDTP